MTAIRTEHPGPMTTLRLPVATATAIKDAIAERDAGFAAAEDGDRTGYDRSLISTAIDALAATGLRFSANDVRDLLAGADVRTTLIGAQFSAALTGERIRFVGWERSTKKNTHGKRINTYVGLTGRTNP